MSYLIIYAHPNPQSFNHAILEKVQDVLRKTAQPVTVRDLYALKFNPVLTGADFQQIQQGGVLPEVQTEQDAVRAADTLVFIYPVWWFSMPAILKGYIDRVFSRGFAYDYADGGIKGLLPGKRVVILNTTGGPEQAYAEVGFKKALQTTTDTGVFGLCGMEVLRHEFFYGVPVVSAQERTRMLSSLETMFN